MFPCSKSPTTEGHYAYCVQGFPECSFSHYPSLSQRKCSKEGWQAWAQDLLSQHPCPPREGPVFADTSVRAQTGSCSAGSGLSCFKLKGTEALRKPLPRAAFGFCHHLKSSGPNHFVSTTCTLGDDRSLWIIHILCINNTCLLPIGMFPKTEWMSPINFLKWHDGVNLKLEWCF